ncbi:MAG: type II toxin-antitoxin system RelE/ParE family toxin [Planctomycetes bacterium]|nr:type II toxin-antitoxin system RelE/ParE family toxin [Planctomycetota bacterium]
MGERPRYKVLIVTRAREMLNSHIRFMANANATAARKTNKRIMDAIRSLAMMPERFPLFKDHIFGNKHRKMFVENWYLIISQIKEQTVFVEYIMDCRQDYNWLID